MFAGKSKNEIASELNTKIDSRRNSYEQAHHIIKGDNYFFWDGQNDLGKTSTSGIYFINLIQGFETLGTKKVIFLK